MPDYLHLVERQLVQQIEDYLRANPDIHQEFLMVKFTQFGASSLDILVYCFTVTTDWVKHLQARQEVQLKVMDLVEAQGLEIAFPTQTVHLAGAAPVEVGESSGN